jgi:hypothetical protein
MTEAQNNQVTEVEVEDEAEDTITSAPSVEGDYSIDEAKAKVVDDKAFSKAVDHLRKSLSKSREEIHAVLLQAVYAAKVYNDYARATTVLTMLNEVLSPASTIQVRRWIMAMGPFRWVKTDKGYKFRKRTGEGAMPFNLKFAEKNPFWMWSPVREEDLENMLKIGTIDDDVKPIRRLFHSLKDKLEAFDNKAENVEVVDEKSIDTERELMEDLRVLLHKYGGIDSTKKSAKKAA